MFDFPDDSWVVIALSLKISIVAVLSMLPPAFFLAWMLERWNVPFKLLIDALVHLPLVVPPVVTGWLLLILFGANGPIGQWLQQQLGITLLFRWTGAALAAAIMALPLMVRAIRLSIEAIDMRLEEAAQSLGAGRLRIFLTISLPLTTPGLLVAIVLGFARSLGEFGATITFVSDIPGETRTLPIAIYSSLQMAGGETVAAGFAVISILLSVAALMISGLLTRRGGKSRGRHVL
jgi:molybdate transport system permease protein